MRKRSFVVAFAMAALCSGGTARADSHYLLPHWGDPGRIVTDRPGFSFTTETVKPGHFLLESAVDYTWNRDARRMPSGEGSLRIRLTHGNSGLPSQLLPTAPRQKSTWLPGGPHSTLSDTSKVAWKTRPGEAPHVSTTMALWRPV